MQDIFTKEKRRINVDAGWNLSGLLEMIAGPVYSAYRSL